MCHQEPHRQGEPCNVVACPKCGAAMARTSSRALTQTSVMITGFVVVMMLAVVYAKVWTREVMLQIPGGASTSLRSWVRPADGWEPT